MIVEYNPTAKEKRTKRFKHVLIIDNAKYIEHIKISNKKYISFRQGKKYITANKLQQIKQK